MFTSADIGNALAAIPGEIGFATPRCRADDPDAFGRRLGLSPRARPRIKRPRIKRDANQQKGHLMTNNMETTGRTEHLLALMTRGDDLFNARDWRALDDVHHPDMIAFIPGSAEPIYGRKAHGAAMQQLVRMFPDVRVHTPYPIQFGGDDWITVVTNATGTFTG